MNIPTIIYLSLMLTVIGLAALTYGMFLSKAKNKIVCVFGAVVSAIAFSVYLSLIIPQ